jgi:hypothetical protein
MDWTSCCQGLLLRPVLREHVSPSVDASGRCGWLCRHYLFTAVCGGSRRGPSARPRRTLIEQKNDSRDKALALLLPPDWFDLEVRRAEVQPRKARRYDQRTFCSL